MRVANNPTEQEPRRTNTFQALDSIFNPRAIAVIGASPTSGTVGNIQFKRIVDFGHNGEIYPVNPHCEEIMGFKAYSKVTEVPSDIDLGIVVVPAQVVSEVIEDCIRKKIKGVVILSSGFGEKGEEGKKLERELADIVKGTGTRIVRPNCMACTAPLRE